MSKNGFGQTTITAEIIKTTEKAVLIEVDGAEHWVPRKVCLDGDSLVIGDEDLVVADWWLEQAGLEDLA